VAVTADRRLILNADDYGFTPGVSAGILECVQAGVVTSISVMVNTPGFEDGVRRLRVLAKPPGVGLHLNLTAGAPVSAAHEVPSLVDARGRFLSLPGFALRALAGAIVTEDVAREATAQLARLREAWPDVDHLDAHQHVHALPGVRAGVFRAAALGRVHWVRRPVEPAGARPGALKRLALHAAWGVGSQGAAAAAAAAGAAAVRVIGIGLVGGPRFLEALLGLLDRVGPGVTELIVHPGRAEPELARWDPYLRERDAELEALLSAPLRERLARGDLALIDFRAA
jgi:chitin disaccharide deacetylase